MPAASGISRQHLPQSIQLLPAQDVFKSPPEGDPERIFCVFLLHEPRAARQRNRIKIILVAAVKSGPVTPGGEFMDINFWHARWQANQIGFHQNEINSYLVRYWPSLQLVPQSRVFVPLCGKTLDMIWLLDQGHTVVGNEISQLAVEAFFAENRLTPDNRQETGFTRWSCDRIEILCGDFFRLTLSDIGRIDALYDRAALIALMPAQRARYAARITEILEPQTPLLLITLDYEQQQMPGPPFAVSANEVSNLYRNEFSVEQLAHTDIIEARPQYREKGLNTLYESVYRLQRR
jgi:thiopurine S-methyltransferase